MGTRLRPPARASVPPLLCSQQRGSRWPPPIRRSRLLPFFPLRAWGRSPALMGMLSTATATALSLTPLQCPALQNNPSSMCQTLNLSSPSGDGDGLALLLLPISLPPCLPDLPGRSSLINFLLWLAEQHLPGYPSSLLPSPAAARLVADTPSSIQAIATGFPGGPIYLAACSRN